MKLNLHHTGVVVSDIEEAAATYVRRFGYCLESAVIYDHAQQASVQFLRLSGDQVYLELVSPSGQASKVAGALRKGGGFHHLCFAVDDIEASCSTMRQSGFFLISPPVSAVAFSGRRIAWLMGKDRLLTELLERGTGDGL